jgi:sec-independent protein translocase protein TatC
MTPDKPVITNDTPVSLLEHIRELRNRLMVAFGALLITTIASFTFTKPLLVFLAKPVGEEKLVLLGPTEGFIIYFKVALICGVAMALPIMLYELVAYVVPGLYPKERRYLYFILPSATISFVAGVFFTYYALLTNAIPFLQGFLSDIFTPSWTLEKYMSLVTNLMMWIGLAFETPLVMGFISWLGVLSPKKMAGFRRYAIVLSAVLAASITPTVDPFNMSIVMVPLLLLYELGLILARFAYRGPPDSKEQKKK